MTRPLVSAPPKAAQPGEEALGRGGARSRPLRRTEAAGEHPGGGQPHHRRRRLRIQTRPRLRYFGRSGAELVLLLVGGDKGSQRKDIKRAQEYWAIYLKEAQRGTKK